MPRVTRRRFIRDLTRYATGLGFLPLLAACGQADSSPTPARVGARAPSDSTPGGSPTVQTSPTSGNPWLTPAPTPPAYVTPFPTGIATRPRSTQPPTPASQVIPTSVIPTPWPTKQPSDPYYLGISGVGRLGAVLGTRQSELIALGVVLDILPARWSTPDGTRPPNPHQQPPPASIFRPVVFQTAQILKGQAPGPILYPRSGGGQVGVDAVVYEGDLGKLFSFEVGEQCVLFLSAARAGTSGSVPRVNDQAVLNVDEHYTVLPDGRATNGRDQMTLQQLLDKIAAGSGAPGATATPSPP